MTRPTFIVPFSERNSDYEPVLVPEGTHFARIYKIIDLGTQEDTYMGESKGYKRIFRIYFEFPKQKHVFKEEIGEQPLAMSKEFKMSFTSPDAPTFSALTRLVNAVGDNGHDRHYDVFGLLGKTCQIKVAHKTSEKNSKTYANISDFSRLSEEQKEMMGMKPEAYAQVNSSSWFYLDADHFNAADFESLPQWLKDKIVVSPEYNQLTKSGSTQSKKGEEVPEKLPDINVDELNVQMPF